MQPLLGAANSEVWPCSIGLGSPGTRDLVAVGPRLVIRAVADRHQQYHQAVCCEGAGMIVEYEYLRVVELSPLALAMMFMSWPATWRVGAFVADPDRFICWRGIAWTAKASP